MTAAPNKFPSASHEEEVILRLLTHVDREEKITQRSLAKELGIALGLANTYLKKCTKKGLVKIKEIPTNRYAYYLTPKGFAEKSRLTGDYLSQSFSLFRRARVEYNALIETCVRANKTKIAIFGSLDIVEIVVLCARGWPISIVGAVISEPGAGLIEDIHVANKVADLEDFDAILLADLSNPQEAYENLENMFGPNKVYSPEFMNVSKNSPKLRQVRAV